MILWFPEIFDRFSQFNKQHPGESAGVCEVFQEQPLLNSTLKMECDPAIATNVFLDTIIIGFSCIPTSASLSYFMYKIGKKAVLGKLIIVQTKRFFTMVVLVSSLVLSGLCTLSLNWVVTQGQTLALSCVFEALTSILEAVLFCVVVDLFPTNLRSVHTSSNLVYISMIEISVKQTLSVIHYGNNCKSQMSLFFSLIIT